MKDDLGGLPSRTVLSARSLITLCFHHRSSLSVAPQGRWFQVSPGAQMCEKNFRDDPTHPQRIKMDGGKIGTWEKPIKKPLAMEGLVSRKYGVGLAR